MELAEKLVEKHREGRQVLCKAAAKVVGKLVSAAQAVPVSKILFREVNARIYTSKQSNWGGSIWLSKEAVRDLLWIIECFLAWNGRSSPIWVESMVKTVDCVRYRMQVLRLSGSRCTTRGTFERSMLQEDCRRWRPVCNSSYRLRC